MKKNIILFAIIALLISPICCQTIEWEKASKIDSDMETPNCDASGVYIGSIDDEDFFINYEINPQRSSMPCTDFAFTKVINNKVSKFIPTIEAEMIVFDVSIIDNEIAVLNCKEGEDDNWNVRVDYYSTSDFSFLKTKTIYSFEKSDEFEFVHYNKSKNGLKHGLVLDVKNEKFKFKKLYFLTLNESYEAISQNQYITDDNYQIYIQNINVSDAGNILVSYFNKEGIVKKDQKKDSNGRKIKADDPNFFPEINTYQLIYYTKEGFNKIKISKDDINKFQRSTKIYEKNNQQFYVFFADSENVKGLLIDINKMTVNELFSESVHYGIWQFDYISHYENGNVVLVLINKDYTVHIYQSGNQVIRKLFEWEKSYRIISFNPENGNIAYNTAIARDYVKTVINLSYQQNIFLSTFYHIEGNNLYLIYNTDQSKNENFKYEKELSKADVLQSLVVTKNIETRVSKIDQFGTIETNSVYKSTSTTPIILPAYIHKIDKEIFQIAKGLKDMITYGTLIL